MMVFKEFLRENVWKTKGNNPKRDDSVHQTSIDGYNVNVQYQNQLQDTHHIHFNVKKGRTRSGTIANPTNPKSGLKILRFVKKSIDTFVGNRKPHQIMIPSTFWARNSPRHKVYARVAQDIAKRHGGKYVLKRRTEHTVTFPQNDPYPKVKRK